MGLLFPHVSGNQVGVTDRRAGWVVVVLGVWGLFVVLVERLAAAHARQFHLAGLRCLEQRPLTPTSFEMLPVPAGVLLGFACETYLKALLTHANVAERGGHELVKLAERLPVGYRDRLGGAYQPVNGETFDVALVGVNKMFVEIRYFYEHPERAASLFDARQLAVADALARVCQQYSLDGPLSGG